jgi:excisionase family DNA binding protein
MTVDRDADLLTIEEAARLLKVSAVTIHRWLKQGRLPAYRLGPRYVRIRRADLATVLTPTRREEAEAMGETMPIQAKLRVMPLSSEEVRRMGDFLDQSQALIDRIRARREGRPLPSSWPLIRKAREERSKRS